MRNETSAFVLGIACVAFALSGCGNSTPEPAAPPVSSNAPAVAVAPSPAPVAAVPASPAQGAFATLSAQVASAAARNGPDCNLDAIDGKPPGLIARTSRPLFLGWAADSATKSVPPSVMLVLKGAQDFAVQAPTGYPRNDVAQATKQPAFARSGFSVQADLAAVTPGQYSVTILEPVGGQTIACSPGKQITVQ